MKNNKGFTLIELLTAISIISLMANIGFASSYSASIKARDVATLNILDTVKIGLELYLDDFGEYPTQNGYGTGFCKEDTSFSCTNHSNCTGDCIPSVSFLGYTHPIIDGISAKCLDETGFHETCSGKIYIKNIPSVHSGNPPPCFILNPLKCAPIYRKELSGGYSITYGQETLINNQPPDCYRIYAEDKKIDDCFVASN